MSLIVVGVDGEGQQTVVPLLGQLEIELPSTELRTPLVMLHF